MGHQRILSTDKILMSEPVKEILILFISIFLGLVYSVFHKSCSIATRQCVLYLWMVRHFRYASMEEHRICANRRAIVGAPIEGPICYASIEETFYSSAEEYGATVEG